MTFLSHEKYKVWLLLQPLEKFKSEIEKVYFENSYEDMISSLPSNNYELIELSVFHSLSVRESLADLFFWIKQS